MSLPYYKKYPRDFIEGTIGMDLELKGAYGLILDLIYMQDGNLPDDARYISGLLGCTIRKWNSLRDRLLSMGKIYVNGEFLSNYRADNELETLRKFRENQAEKGRASNKNNEITESTVNPARVKPESEPDISCSLRSQETRAQAGEDGDLFGAPVPAKPPPKPTGFSSAQFDAFWSRYPHKVGKGDAEKKFHAVGKRTGKQEVPFDQLMDGLNRYIATKPVDRSWCNPSTWLNQERWTDEPAGNQAGQPANRSGRGGLAASMARVLEKRGHAERAGPSGMGGQQSDFAGTTIEGEVIRGDARTNAEAERWR